MIATGGRWNRADGPLYFIACTTMGLWQAKDVHDNLLLAVNEVKSADDAAKLDALLDGRQRLFIDSGVFNLAFGHAQRHGIGLTEAIGLPPGEVDGFDALFAKYVTLVSRIADRVWGYIEIDLGGRDNKIATRARLEALGLNPIPVWHPFNDGAAYFHELAQTYDRICVGNLVQADPATRKRLVATVWEHRRQYPHLWVHLLGLTPSTLTVAYPPDSCDSSTWLSAVRWGIMQATVATARVWEAGTGWNYELAGDSSGARGHHKARTLAGYDAAMVDRCMRSILTDQRDGLTLAPQQWRSP